MLTVWGRRSSFNLQKVMWLVGELGVAHEHIELGGQFGGLDSAEFGRRNPHRKVPVIDDDGVVVWESQTILRYLAARYGSGGEASNGEPRLWHDEPARRAQVEQWMDWSQTTLQPDFLMGIFWGFYRTPADERDLLDSQLAEHDFLLGNALSLADIVIGTHLYRYFNLDIERPVVPLVKAYYERLQSRSAYQDHVMVPFAELEGRLAY
jgi:glutathione S-transferase